MQLIHFLFLANKAGILFFIAKAIVAQSGSTIGLKHFKTLISLKRESKEITLK